MRQHPIVRREPSLRAGITVVEVLAVLAVMGLLLAIIVPALQSARESARRLDCSHRQRQLGVAVHQHLTVFRRFPADTERCFSYLVALLPMLEQDVLRTQIDAAGCWSTQSVPILENLQQQQVLSLLHCPADPDARAVHTNYLGNSGPGFFRGAGGFLSTPAATAANFSDGLSNTAAITEFVTGHGRQPMEPIAAPVNDLAEWKVFVEQCQAFVPPGPYPGSLMGNGWLQPGHPLTAYTHTLPPGSNSCRSTIKSAGNMARSVASPRSYHRGGVNVLMADGRVEFIAQSIDQTVWRRLGTRNDTLSIWEDN